MFFGLSKLIELFGQCRLEIKLYSIYNTKLNSLWMFKGCIQGHLYHKYRSNIIMILHLIVILHEDGIRWYRSAATDFTRILFPTINRMAFFYAFILTNFKEKYSISNNSNSRCRHQWRLVGYNTNNNKILARLFQCQTPKAWQLKRYFISVEIKTMQL